MKEMSDAPGAQLVDRMIDEMVARRSAARPGGSGSGYVRSPLTADEALLSELAGLGAVDWPADEAGDRIARSVAKLASQPTANPLDRPGHRRRGRPGRRLGWVSVSVGAAAAASLVAAALFGPWLHEIPGRGAVAPATSPSHPAGQGQFSRSVMRLVESTTSPFQPVGTGDNRSTFFTCVTSSVCYAGKQPLRGAEIVERTSDGGATWRPGAVLPDGLGFRDVSCPTTQMCAGVVGRLQIAIITDGGARLHIQHLTALPGISPATLTTLSCATATECVAGIDGPAASTFLHTSNGGESWTAARVVPAVISQKRTNMGALRCDPDGSCIGLAIVGPIGADQAAVRTADYGRTWTISHTIPTPTGARLLQMTCGDGHHCMMLSDNGVIVMITAATDGKISWREQAFPASWPNLGVEVSCATGRDCFISAGGAAGNTRAAIEATHNGGRSWNPLSLPTVDGEPLAIVYPMSCTLAGCIAVAATWKMFAGKSGEKRVIISNLSPSR